jgi:hypothetical protein
VSTTSWIFLGVAVFNLLGMWAEHGWRRALGVVAASIAIGVVIAVLPGGSPARVYVIVAAIIALVLWRAREHARARAARAN